MNCRRSRIRFRFDQLAITGQVTHSPGRIGYASGKLPYNRLIVQWCYGELRKPRLLQRSSTCEKAPYFALHIRIAIGFLKGIGFATNLNTTFHAKATRRKSCNV